MVQKISLPKRGRPVGRGRGHPHAARVANPSPAPEPAPAPQDRRGWAPTTQCTRCAADAPALVGPPAPPRPLPVQTPQPWRMPTFATLQGPVVGLLSRCPLRAWTARLLVDTDKPSRAPSPSPPTRARCASRAGGPGRGWPTARLEALLVGGRGGLARRLPARSAIARSRPPGAAGPAVGRRVSLASTSEGRLLDQQLPHWTRLEAPTSVNSTGERRWGPLAVDRADPGAGGQRPARQRKPRRAPRGRPERVMALRARAARPRARQPPSDLASPSALPSTRSHRHASAPRVWARAACWTRSGHWGRSWRPGPVRRYPARRWWGRTPTARSSWPLHKRLGGLSRVPIRYGCPE